MCVCVRGCEGVCLCWWVRVCVCLCGCPIGVLDSSVAFSATMALIYKQQTYIAARFVKWFCPSCSGASTHAYVHETKAFALNFENQHFSPDIR